MPKYITQSFNDLDNNTLYELLRLRSEVFVVEQNCVYLDLDNKDQDALHCYIQLENGDITGYTRIFNIGKCYNDFTSIGRVIVNPQYRRQNFGKEIMKYSIKECEKIFGQHPIKIGAQQYLRKFYHELGFKETGNDYLEDGIPHTTLIFPKDGF